MSSPAVHISAPQPSPLSPSCCTSSTWGVRYKKEKSATCWSDHRTVILQHQHFPLWKCEQGANCMGTQGLKLPFFSCTFSWAPHPHAHPHTASAACWWWNSGIFGNWIARTTTLVVLQRAASGPVVHSDIFSLFRCVPDLTSLRGGPLLSVPLFLLIMFLISLSLFPPTLIHHYSFSTLYM